METSAIENKVIERFGKEKFAEAIKMFAPRQLNVIEVEDKLAVLRPITTKELSAYSTMLVNPDDGMDKASHYLLNALWLFGDEEIRNDEEYFMSAMLTLQNVIELKKSNFYRC